MTRLDRGTTIPPTTCSCTTVYHISIRYAGAQRHEGGHTKGLVTQDNGVVLLRWEEVREGREISQIVPTYQRICIGYLSDH